MSVREQQVNDALRTLDEMHWLRRIERDEYRRRRRQVLESLGDATGCTGRDTVRRVLPASEPLPANTTVRRCDTTAPDVPVTRGASVGVRWIAACVLLIGVIACAAAVCWYVMTA